MARRKSIPDETIYGAVRALLVEGGDKAVSFATVSQATGLAAPTLVQRYGSRDGMLRAALMAAWDALDAATDTAEAEAPLSAKGAQMLLKALGAESCIGADLSLLATEFRDPQLRVRAEAWRARVETALALRLGGTVSGREAAAILFAAWQGQRQWLAAGGKGFKLKDAVRRISG